MFRSLRTSITYRVTESLPTILKEPPSSAAEVFAVKVLADGLLSLRPRTSIAEIKMSVAAEMSADLFSLIRSNDTNGIYQAF